jgi:TonB family protein
MNGQESRFEEVAQRLSDGGDIESQIILGRFLMKKGRYPEAEKWLKSAATHGDAEAQWHLAGLYFTSIPPRNAEGEKWVRASATQDFDLAVSFLENRSHLPRIVNGKVVTDSLFAYQNRIVIRKIEHSSDAQVQCYGSSRSVIVRNAALAADICGPEIKNKFGSSVPESLAQRVAQEVVDCSNRELFRLVDKTANEIAGCLMKLEFQNSRDVWVGLVQNKIRKRLVLPEGTPSDIKATYSVTQLPNGNVISATLKSSSGFEPYDVAAYRAILNASPLPRPRDPADFVRTLELTFTP